MPPDAPTFGCLQCRARSNTFVQMYNPREESPVNKAVMVAAVCAVLAGCASEVKKVQEAPAQPAPAPVAAPAPAKAAPVVQAESEAARLARLMRELAGKSVYFDYDQFTLKPESQDAVRQQADFIAKASQDKVVVEGNADERGSSEYNLALGQKRAEAVRRALVVLGIPDSRIEAVSYGKERPRATCHEESCWQQNRRVDFVHKLQ